MGVTELQGAKEVVKGSLPEGFTRDMIALAEQAVNNSPRMPTQVWLPNYHLATLCKKKCLQDYLTGEGTEHPVCQ